MALHGSLTGKGAAYIRVSTDQQDTRRQYEAIEEFEKRHNVRIKKAHWFKDEGWARDKAEKRPAFNQLLRLADASDVNWIVVDKLDRFGTKSSKQLMAYLYRLEEAGCRLFDASGKEWTGEDDATEITALIEGKNSAKEQRDKSYRVLAGKVTKARLGEWQGGPVKLGFDVACYHRETDAELWRVVFEGRNKRVKVYPDGRAERFDGKGNFPKCQEVTEVLRVAPSNDKAKVDAARSVFERYATESVSFTALAHDLNALGWRNSYGGMFQSHHVQRMLEDPIYLGYYTFNKLHVGKFSRWADGQVVPVTNYDEKVADNDKADWVQGDRLFKPIVNRKLWDTVQRKLESRTTRSNSPRSANAYLAGLVYCGNCGGRMVTGRVRKRKTQHKDGFEGERYEYFCGSYHKAVREKRREECECLRNSVFQDVLEQYIAQYLQDTGQRLDVLTSGIDRDELMKPLKDQLFAQHDEYVDAMMRLLDYIRDNDPDGWREMWQTVPETQDVPVERAVEYYRRCFSADRVDGQLEELEAEHDVLTEKCLNLQTERAIAKANQQLAELESRITQLEQQRQNEADIVEQQWREVLDLSDAVKSAEAAMYGEQNLRRRAEALRGIIERIECTFTATGSSGGGWGKKNAKLATVTFYPVVGESLEFSADSKGTLLYSNAHSCI